MKRPYLVHSNGTGVEHLSRHFAGFEEATAFLAANGGGMVLFGGTGKRRVYKKVRTVAPKSAEVSR
jgi:hypothetical protein